MQVQFMHVYQSSEHVEKENLAVEGKLDLHKNLTISRDKIRIPVNGLYQEVRDLGEDSIPVELFLSFISCEL